jgi:predicted nucleic acid-binding protein
MNAVDTNVLLYVHDYRDPAKQTTAKALIDSLPDAVLLWQVACEYIAASRKFARLGYSSDKAWQDVRKLKRLWAMQLPK